MRRSLDALLATLQERWAREIGADPEKVFLKFVPTGGVQLVRCELTGLVADHCAAFLTPEALEMRIRAIDEEKVAA